MILGKLFLNCDEDLDEGSNGQESGSPDGEAQASRERSARGERLNDSHLSKQVEGKVSARGSKAKGRTTSKRSGSSRAAGNTTTSSKLTSSKERPKPKRRVNEGGEGRAVSALVATSTNPNLNPDDTGESVVPNSSALDRECNENLSSVSSNPDASSRPNDVLASGPPDPDSFMNCDSRFAETQNLYQPDYSPDFDPLESDPLSRHSPEDDDLYQEILNKYTRTPTPTELTQPDSGPQEASAGEKRTARSTSEDEHPRKRTVPPSQYWATPGMAGSSKGFSGLPIRQPNKNGKGGSKGKRRV
jgi:hypothetical protein